MVKISPSLLAADFANLSKDIHEVEQGGAHYLHIDVMDGHFVPNISFGLPIMESIRHVTSLPMDVHLMIEQPDRYIENFVHAGAHTVTVHVEACRHIYRTIEYIQSKGINAGVAINPGTPVAHIQEVLPFVDLVLVMTVNPGFGGQSFIKHTVGKIEQVAQLKQKLAASFDIQVDGGINQQTAKVCQAAGANILVAGSAIFNESNRQQAIEQLIRIK